MGERLELHTISSLSASEADLFLPFFQDEPLQYSFQVLFRGGPHRAPGVSGGSVRQVAGGYDRGGRIRRAGPRRGPRGSGRTGQETPDRRSQNDGSEAVPARLGARGASYLYLYSIYKGLHCAGPECFVVFAFRRHIERWAQAGPYLASF